MPRACMPVSSSHESASGDDPMTDQTSGEPTPFGRWLKDKMRDHVPRLYRPELAEMVGVDPTTISRWIMKPQKPQTDKLRALADALGEDYGEVLTRAGHGRPAESVESVEIEIDPLARELGRMLDENSPLSDAERERLRIVIDSGLELYRPRMRRTRRAV